MSNIGSPEQFAVNLNEV